MGKIEKSCVVLPRYFGHPVTRYCTVPAGNAILFPILNSECSYIEFPQLKNEIELRDCAKTIQDIVISPSASIDNNELRICKTIMFIHHYLIFLPKNNILGDLHRPPKQLQMVTGYS